MKKTMVVVLVLLAGVAAGAFAQVALSGAYVLEIDQKADGVLAGGGGGREYTLRMSTQGGIYAFAVATEQILTGTAFAVKGTTYVVLYQYGPEAVALYYGSVTGNTMKGTWVHLVNGNSGDWVMRPK